MKPPYEIQYTAFLTVKKLIVIYVIDIHNKNKETKSNL